MTDAERQAGSVPERQAGFETRAIHDGQPPDPATGAVAGTVRWTDPAAMDGFMKLTMAALGR